ncbi:CsbD family protein [Methylobacterium sp. Gmos1]
MDSDRIIGAGQELGGKVQQRVGDWTGDAGTRAQGLADQAAGAARTVYGQAKDGLRGLADAAPDSLDQARETGRRYYRRADRAVARQVGDHHLAALLVAGAIGYAFGWLLHDRG